MQSASRPLLTLSVLGSLLLLASGRTQAQPPTPPKSEPTRVPSVQHQDVQRHSLKLLHALPIDGIREPSGLTWYKRELYAVSDKVHDKIYRLRWSEREASAIESKVQWTSQPERFLDWEGITQIGNSLLVISEEWKCVFSIDAAGQISRKSCLTKQATTGWFTKPGSGPEGIAVLPDGTIVIAAEREPSGLMFLREGSSPYSFETDANYPAHATRPKDATGLWVEKNELWCLTRNGEAIARLRSINRKWRTVGVLSFQHLAGELEYSDETYGLAEGLAANAEHVFVVLDNNGMRRKNVPGDQRPLLLVFERPMLPTTN